MLRASLYYDTCASRSTSMYVHVRDQNDNATYASTRWVTTVRHFLACEDVAGGSQQLGGESFFARMHFLACKDVAGGSQHSGGNVFSRNTVARPVGPSSQGETFFPRNTGGLSGGSLLSGGGIIIFA